MFPPPSYNPSSDPSSAANRASLYPPNDKRVVRELIETFKRRLPEELWERHVLDEQRVAEDLERVIKKGAAEYIKSL